MTTDPNENNPYRSPEESSASDDVSTVSDLHRQFPWRIVPVVLLYLYGGLVTIFSVLTLIAILLGGYINVNGHNASESQLNIIMCQLIFISAHGCCVIAIGRNVWKRRRRRGFVYLTISIVLIVLFVVAGYFVSRLPSGKKIRTTVYSVGSILPSSRNISRIA